MILSFGMSDWIEINPYGENWHQRASKRINKNSKVVSTVRAEQVHGRPMSFNNYRDAQAAMDIAYESPEPSLVLPSVVPLYVVLVKHGVECGSATGDENKQVITLERAWQGDPEASFGGIVALNRKVKKPVFQAMSQRLPPRNVE